jgi:hypothetical protein
MKISKLTYQHNEHGNVVAYHSSPSAAKKAFDNEKATAEKDGYDVDNMEIDTYEVKGTKKAFLHFLNNLTPSKDNG